MAIHKFFDKSVTVRRFTNIGGYKQSFTATATVEMHIQASADAKGSLVQGQFGRLYAAWCDLSAPIYIEEGDIVTDAAGRDFEVKTINRRDFGINQHQEIIMERIDHRDNI